MTGLSLAYKLCQAGLSHKKILVIDKSLKTENDRTLAFWAVNNQDFNEIVKLKWDSIYMINNQSNKAKIDIKPYSYNLIRGIDFYNFTQSYLQKQPNLSFVYNEISEIINLENIAKVILKNNEEYSAQYIFDSTTPLDLINPKNINYYQHFYGQILEFEQDIIDISAPEMMNYEIQQVSKECRFIYLIPISKTRALLEYTVFSDNIISKADYEILLNEYLKNRFKNHNYKIEEEEYGVIPMSDTIIKEFHASNIIKIGTAAGYTQPATGYTFSMAQKRLNEIVDYLKLDKNPAKLHRHRPLRHELYASTLLRVMQKGDIPMAEFFYGMFAKNKVTDVFAFLNGDSNIGQELKIMWNTPIWHFGIAFLEVSWRRIWK